MRSSVLLFWKEIGSARGLERTTSIEKRLSRMVFHSKTNSPNTSRSSIEELVEEDDQIAWSRLFRGSG